MATGHRSPVLGAVVGMICLPAALVVVQAVSFHIHNRSNGTLVSSGATREYLLYVPSSYDRTKPTPLVISMHGGALWPAAQMEISRWNRVADEQGFIVVYPSGVADQGPRHWEADLGPTPNTDVRFISDLIDSLEARYNIDRARIYADGFSNGGGMAFVLACVMPDRIAAVGMVGAAVFLPWSRCPATRPMPLIAFFGTQDPAVPYHGGRSWVARTVFPDIPAWAGTWAHRNRCTGNPGDSIMAADLTRRAYSGCADSAVVLLYSILGGGHTWPGGKPLPQWFVGKTTASVDASRVMWEFYRGHPLRR